MQSNIKVIMIMYLKIVAAPYFFFAITNISYEISQNSKSSIMTVPEVCCNRCICSLNSAARPIRASGSICPASISMPVTCIPTKIPSGDRPGRCLLAHQPFCWTLKLRRKTKKNVDLRSTASSITSSVLDILEPRRFGTIGR